MLHNLLICISLLLVASAEMAVISNDIEGYSSGYLSDCPGSTKKAVIKRESLKHLFFAVHGPGDIFTMKKNKYTYHQMRQMARDPYIDFKRKTFIYVGGFLDSTNSPVGSVMCKLFMDKGYNCLSSDSIYFNTRHYPVSVRFSRPVGYHFAEMLANLTQYGLDPKKLHLMGPSLGSHIMGFIAKNYRLLTGMNISRLTALDPAGPCFRHLGPDQRVDKSDADFVEVIMTNIDNFGMATPIGHVNFYVNGGEFQPGSILSYFCTMLCSHARSYFLWVSAMLHQTSFIGIKCNSVQQARNRDCYENTPRVTNILGLKVNKSKHGIFYLSTHNIYPYYMGEKGFNKENDFYLNNLLAFNNETVLEL